MSRLDDGFATLITFPSAPTIKFYEKEVTPPGISGGGENDTTTMRNTAWRTKAPKRIKTLTEMSASVAYDPAVYDDVVAILQENQLINVEFPDGSSVDFWGWLDEFTPNAAKEGEQPTANIKVIPSNQDNSGVEQAPVYNAPA